MANLFLKQAKQYAATRPAYPPELFDFIASKTARHDLAWDVGTGSGQAIPALAKLYKDVVGTDTSAQQLFLRAAPPQRALRPHAADLPLDGIHAAVAPPGSVDLVTVAQAFHWLDLPRFYAQRRDFPFDPVDGEAHTGPFEFSTERRMDLDGYLAYITSWSAYQTAKEKGVELLDEATVRGFADAWGGDRVEVKTVRYPIFLRIGKVRTE
ncbi:hypothetical protein OsJ_11290 [Oryza sativa Japonica Group]|uniref:Methyltransferase type 11 domain-containing protein n=1 Tax=Oryza sativa subsp. japonica TaxID=39947 RepID=B9F919_ORYSJ|nr:hypothetical protein OsJ_11290 [Oryza sativa Japonica Group]